MPLRRAQLAGELGGAQLAGELGADAGAGDQLDQAGAGQAGAGQAGAVFVMFHFRPQFVCDLFTSKVQRWRV